jgi:GNAT superfamily N-acetyltransferase
MGAGPVTIRRATKGDVEIIHRLLLELADALGKSAEIRSSAEDIRRYGFEHEPRFEVVLAFDGDDAIGLAVFFYEFSTWRGQPGAYVQDLYVSPRLRGRGLGRDLLGAVRARAEEWGGRYIKLSVYDRNPAALAFYHGVGFESCEDELVQVLRW